MVLNKKDFVEIEFTGRVKDGEIFDSNIREDLEKIHKDNNPIETKPFTFCIGEGMFLPAIEEFLIGKQVTPETYKIELPSEKAFGKRDTKLIQRIPLKVFKDQNLNPVPGFVFTFDGRVGKVLASSSGRVIVDFNNPIAGKDVVYTVKVLKKVEDINEKAKSLIKFFLKDEFKFEIEGKKIVVHVPKQIAEFAKIFKDKFKDLLGLELEVRPVREISPKLKKEDKKADEQKEPKR